MWGIIFAILAGIAISFQNIINTRLNTMIGALATTTLVHFVGFLASFLLVLSFGSLYQFKNLSQVPWPYFLGGVIGVVIVFSIINSISRIGAGYAVAVMIIAQLIFSFIADGLGLFGIEKIPFSLQRFLGLILLLVGVVLFQSAKK